jgi:hypothetical protein
MRIVGVRPAPVALLFALAYSTFGLINFVIFAASSLPTFVLPIGFVFGIFHLTLNVPLPRSEDLLANGFQCVAAIACYALTGWITGVVFVLVFNFGAEKLGGIDARFVEIARNNSAAKEQLPRSGDHTTESPVTGQRV